MNDEWWMTPRFILFENEYINKGGMRIIMTIIDYHYHAIMIGE